jgi:hypothetical protein
MYGSTDKRYNRTKMVASRFWEIPRREAVDAKKGVDLHRNAPDSYQKFNIAKPVGTANMCECLVDYRDKMADQAADRAKAHREKDKASGGVG